MSKQSQQIPITIGPLTEYGWLGGTALSDYIGRKSSYSPNSDGGIDTFRKIGVLQAGYQASNVNGFITQAINSMDVYLASGSLRLYAGADNGAAKFIYQVDTSNHANVSIIASLSTLNQDNGFAITRDYLFATYNSNASVITNLLRIGPLSTGVLATVINASMISQVNSVQIKHVVFPWKSNLYCLHANNLDYLDGNGVTTGILTVGARLPTGMVVKTGCPYGDKIAVGASDNLISNSTRGTRCIVYLYDGVSNDWQKEIPFPENDIKNLAFENGELLAWGVKWIYKYDATAGGFIAMEPLDVSAPITDRAHGVNDSQIYFTGANVVQSYGSPVRHLDRVMNVPFAGVGTGGVCKWVTNTRMYVSNNAGNLLYLSAGAATTQTWRSRVIEMGGIKFRIAWIRVVTEILDANDGLVVGLRDLAGNTYAAGTMTFASDGAILSKEFFAKDFTAEPPYGTETILTLKFDAGNVKVRRVDMILETASEY